MSRRLNKQQLQKLRQLSNDIRVDVITMLGNAKSGHPGGSLSIVELIVALFYCIMNIDPKKLGLHLNRVSTEPILKFIGDKEIEITT